jgi:AsmA protein
MELIDGAWEGTDLWYELRRARALYKQEPAPEPKLPARTQFSSVKATGPVSDGVFRNDDLFAQLPFMQLTGKGSVDFAAAEVDYRMTARILDNPEFVADVSPEELEEFTAAEIPLRITGSLADPSIAPDIEEMLKKEVKKKVEDEIKDKLLKKLFGDDE